MLNKQQNPLWVEKWRPTRVADVVLPADAKRQFETMARRGEISTNLLLAGSPGVGKTSVARALLDEIGADYIELNGSLDGNIDTLRTTITRFASTVSFAGGRKFVLIDEGDHLTHAVQPALRNFLETYSKNCGFIITCNYLEKIIEPLRGRCSVHEFRVSREDAPSLKKEMFARVVAILDGEGVTYDARVVAVVLDNYFPDMRRVINQLQAYSNGGPIDSGMLSKMSDDNIDSLVAHMKNRNYTDARRWIGEHSGEFDTLFRKFYDKSSELLTPDSIPMLVVLIGKYQYQASFCADLEVNFAAFVAEAMANVSWR